MKLGKLEQITDLRSVWKHEAKDFTPWLAKEENLEIISEAVGIDIVVEEQESNVGDFSVDLFATEEGTLQKKRPSKRSLPSRRIRSAKRSPDRCRGRS